MSRKTIAALVAWACGLAPAVDVLADTPVPLEELVITGSRIARDDRESPSPIAVVPGDFFMNTSAATVERVLDQLPQFVPTVGAASNEPGNGGQANISLRGLGSVQTLVLLDGRRLTPADGHGTPDINTVPAALIERVEVVTGGASAAYGSDAVAGVVNFRLKHSLDGVQFDSRWSRTAHGDGTEYSADLTAGGHWADGRLSVLADLGYARREQLNQDARSWSRYPLQYYGDESHGVGPGGAFLDGGAGDTAAGFAVVFPASAAVDDLFVTYGYPPGTVPDSARVAFGVNQDGSLYTVGDQTNPGTVVNYRGPKDPARFNDRYANTNLAASTALQLPLERSTAFVRASMQLAPQTDAYLQMLFADYSASQQLGPPDSGILLMPVTNPYMPADLATLLASRENPSIPFRFLKRMVGLPTLSSSEDRQLLQGTAGIGGVLRGDWRYDAYVQQGSNDLNEQRTGIALTGEIEALISAPDGGQSTCGDFNLLGVHAISATCAQQVTASVSNESHFKQTLAEATLSGPVATLPAGKLLAVVGVFYKRDQFSYQSDPLASSFLPAVPGVIGPRPALAGFPAGADREGHESNTDLFAEVRVPLLADRPAARELELGLGYRRSDYSRAGTLDSFKADLRYQPLRVLGLRGSYQRAMRAPSVDELFFPQLSGQFAVERPADPCDYQTEQRTGPDKAQVEALCLAQGMPANLLPGFEYPLARVEGVSGGNPDLDAEQSESTTFGLVITPAAEGRLGNLQLSIDWYQITLDDAIGRWDADSAIKRCYDPKYNPGYDPHNAYCTYFTRNAINGEIYASVIDRNLSGIETGGIDLQATWTRNLGPGRLGLKEYLGYVDYWRLTEPSGTKVELAGTIGGRVLGGAIPRWKSLLSLDYAFSGTNPYVRWRYVDGMSDARIPDFAVPAVNYLDIGLRQAFGAGTLRGLVLTAGIDNVTDTEPPIFPSWQQANTDPSQYDVLGRRYYFGLQYRFQ